MDEAQDDLAAAVAAAYATFPDLGTAGPLQVCHCAVCMTEEMAAEIRRTPRARLTPGQLGEYLNSAHDGAAPLAVHQLRWLLPRLLECCASGPWPYDLIEYTFGKLAAAGFATWPGGERLAVRAVFLQLFGAALRAERQEAPEVLLEAFVRGGEPVTPYLGLWDGDRSEAASLALAQLVGWRLTHDRAGRLALRDGWGDGEAVRAFIKWLERPETAARLQEAFFAASDARAAETLSLAHQVLARE